VADDDVDPSSSTTNILTPDTTRPPAEQQPIHANSHAANLQDPSRTSTSELTLSAFRQYHLQEAIISALTNPLPYGDDGEHTEADLDFEEKGVR
jgi:hsp70-interacting protein